MKKPKKQPTTKRERQTYTLDIKDKAKKYFILGLSIKDISKLIDAPYRTVESWYRLENWKKLIFSPKQAKALELQNNGKSYSEIAILMNVSKPTVYRYLKTAKQNKRNENL